MMKSRDVMTSKVITIHAKATMAQAYTIMNERNFRHLPVVDDQKSVVGILSDRDVHLAMNVQKISKTQQSISLNDESLVEDFMTWPVYVVSEETSIRKIAEEMLAQRVSAFLVQDSDGHMRGIVTTDDLIKLLLIEQPLSHEATLKSLTRYFFSPGINS